jgi:hypothetical protein
MIRQLTKYRHYSQIPLAPVTDSFPPLCNDRTPSFGRDGGLIYKNFVSGVPVLGRNNRLESASGVAATHARRARKS